MFTQIKIHVGEQSERNGARFRGNERGGIISNSLLCRKTWI
jgi:hypothetical protein